MRAGFAVLVVEQTSLPTPQRPGLQIEPLNVGLITALRPEFTPAKNKVRNAERRLPLS
jgi:hypothetical protein